MHPCFFIFSDDIEWCEQNLKINNATYITPQEGLYDYHDFELMRNCQYHIIANSTFSWWAAYLDSKKDKTVIVPRIWFCESYRQKCYEKGDMILDDWTIL